MQRLALLHDITKKSKLKIQTLSIIHFVRRRSKRRSTSVRRNRRYYFIQQPGS